MAEILPKKQAIEIENCEIKPSRRGEKLEILLKADSRISESPKKVEVADIDFEDETPEEIELDALEGKFEYAKVTENSPSLRARHCPNREEKAGGSSC